MNFFDTRTLMRAICFFVLGMAAYFLVSHSSGNGASCPLDPSSPEFCRTCRQFDSCEAKGEAARRERPLPDTTGQPKRERKNHDRI